MIRNGLQNSLYALFAHLFVVAVLSGLYIFGHVQWYRDNFITDLIIVTTIAGLFMYILIGYVLLHGQRTSLRDFLSVTSAGILGWAMATPMLLTFHGVHLGILSQHVFWFQWNFSDVMGITWVMRVLVEQAAAQQIIFFTVASFIPSLLMWFGMLLKRKHLLY